ncbi:MAG TPA: YaaR family protein [Methylomusa anaerophila]|nr:YaaR family protein [Methylomusa anaerophila]HML89323.1 YaaR family protein [Methylomusa anaerophila]
MKIGKLGIPNQPVLTDRDAGNRVEKSGGYFASDLLSTQEKQSVERLKTMLAQIDEGGRRLSVTPTYSELKSYRELVRTFIGEAVGRMYTLESRTGWDRQGRHKMFSLIRKIDDKLAEMAEDVRIGQERQLDIMAKHDAIRGMLVDLYM